MARKLFDIEISEITLCKSPANRKKFYIKKSKETNMDTLIDKIKKFLAESDEDIESTLTKEQVERIEKLDKKAQKEIEENLDEILLFEDVPDDLENSIQFFVKKASYDYPEIEEAIDKAGAKLSKTTQTQIKMALEHIKDGPKAIDILKTLLGIDTKKTGKKADGDDEENLSVETLEKLERLEELEKAEKAKLEKEAVIASDKRTVDIITKTLEGLDLVEKGKKTSIDGQDDDGAGDDKKKVKKDEEEDLFPSIPIPVLGD